MDVSVICPVFDTAPALLHAAVASVLSQGADHSIEIIVVDDCSRASGTLAALDQLAAHDRRVTVLRQPRNGGPAVARNRGLAQAGREWIGFIDADDLWPEGKLDAAQAVCRTTAGAGWIGGGYAILGPDDVVHAQPGLAGDPDGPPARMQAPALTRALVGTWLPLGANLIRRELVRSVGGFDRRLSYGEDWLLLLLLSTLSPMEYAAAASYVLRRQGASMMHSTGRLSGRRIHSGILARRDPRLRPVGRELRWWCYAACKDVAMNNALNGRMWRGLGFALRALASDPRELPDLLLFLRCLRMQPGARAAKLRAYSSAEQVQLRPGGDRAP